MLALVVTFLLAAQTTPAAADDGRARDGRRWALGDWKDAFRDGPCEVKIESKRGEYKRELKCKDGAGTHWRGEWKSEFQDGPCLVKQEARHDEFYEEVKCERR